MSQHLPSSNESAVIRSGNDFNNNNSTRSETFSAIRRMRVRTQSSEEVQPQPQAQGASHLRVATDASRPATSTSAAEGEGRSLSSPLDSRSSHQPLGLLFRENTLAPMAHGDASSSSNDLLSSRNLQRMGAPEEEKGPTSPPPPPPLPSPPPLLLGDGARQEHEYNPPLLINSLSASGDSVLCHSSSASGALADEQLLSLAGVLASTGNSNSSGGRRGGEGGVSTHRGPAPLLPFSPTPTSPAPPPSPPLILSSSDSHLQKPLSPSSHPSHLDVSPPPRNVSTLPPPSPQLSQQQHQHDYYDEATNSYAYRGLQQQQDDRLASTTTTTAPATVTATTASAGTTSSKNGRAEPPATQRFKLPAAAATMLGEETDRLAMTVDSAMLTSSRRHSASYSYSSVGGRPSAMLYSVTAPAHRSNTVRLLRTADSRTANSGGGGNDGVVPSSANAMAPPRAVFLNGYTDDDGQNINTKADAPRADNDGGRGWGGGLKRSQSSPSLFRPPPTSSSAASRHEEMGREGRGREGHKNISREASSSSSSPSSSRNSSSSSFSSSSELTSSSLSSPSAERSRMPRGRDVTRVAGSASVANGGKGGGRSATVITTHITSRKITEQKVTNPVAVAQQQQNQQVKEGVGSSNSAAVTTIANPLPPPSSSVSVSLVGPTTVNDRSVVSATASALQQEIHRALQEQQSQPLQQGVGHTHHRHPRHHHHTSSQLQEQQQHIHVDGMRKPLSIQREDDDEAEEEEEEKEVKVSKRHQRKKEKSRALTISSSVEEEGKRRKREKRTASSSRRRRSSSISEVVAANRSNGKLLKRSDIDSSSSDEHISNRRRHEGSSRSHHSKRGKRRIVDEEEKGYCRSDEGEDYHHRPLYDSDDEEDDYDEGGIDSANSSQTSSLSRTLSKVSAAAAYQQLSAVAATFANALKGRGGAADTPPANQQQQQSHQRQILPPQVNFARSANAVLPSFLPSIGQNNSNNNNATITTSASFLQGIASVSGGGAGGGGSDAITSPLLQNRQQAPNNANANTSGTAANTNTPPSQNMLVSAVGSFANTLRSRAVSLMEGGSEGVAGASAGGEANTSFSQPKAPASLLPAPSISATQHVGSPKSSLGSAPAASPTEGLASLTGAGGGGGGGGLLSLAASVSQQHLGNNDSFIPYYQHYHNTQRYQHHAPPPPVSAKTRLRAAAAGGLITPPPPPHSTSRSGTPFAPSASFAFPAPSPTPTPAPSSSAVLGSSVRTSEPSSNNNAVAPLPNCVPILSGGAGSTVVAPHSVSPNALSPGGVVGCGCPSAPTGGGTPILMAQQLPSLSMSIRSNFSPLNNVGTAGVPPPSHYLASASAPPSSRPQSVPRNNPENKKTKALGHIVNSANAFITGPILDLRGVAAASSTFREALYYVILFGTLLVTVGFAAAGHKAKAMTAHYESEYIGMVRRAYEEGVRVTRAMVEGAAAVEDLAGRIAVEAEAVRQLEASLAALTAKSKKKDEGEERGIGDAAQKGDEGSAPSISYEAEKGEEGAVGGGGVFAANATRARAPHSIVTAVTADDANETAAASPPPSNNRTIAANRQRLTPPQRKEIENEVEKEERRLTQELITNITRRISALNRERNIALKQLNRHRAQQLHSIYALSAFYFTETVLPPTFSSSSAPSVSHRVPLPTANDGRFADVVNANDEKDVYHRSESNLWQTHPTAKGGGTNTVVSPLTHEAAFSLLQCQMCLRHEHLRHTTEHSSEEEGTVGSKEGEDEEKLGVADHEAVKRLNSKEVALSTAALLEKCIIPCGQEEQIVVRCGGGGGGERGAATTPRSSADTDDSRRKKNTAVHRSATPFDTVYSFQQCALGAIDAASMQPQGGGGKRRRKGAAEGDADAEGGSVDGEEPFNNNDDAGSLLRGGFVPTTLLSSLFASKSDNADRLMRRMAARVAVSEDAHKRKEKRRDGRHEGSGGDGAKPPSDSVRQRVEREASSCTLGAQPHQHTATADPPLSSSAASPLPPFAAINTIVGGTLIERSLLTAARNAIRVDHLVSAVPRKEEQGEERTGMDEEGRGSGHRRRHTTTKAGGDGERFPSSPHTPSAKPREATMPSSQTARRDGTASHDSSHTDALRGGGGKRMDSTKRMEEKDSKEGEGEEAERKTALLQREAMVAAALQKKSQRGPSSSLRHQGQHAPQALGQDTLKTAAAMAKKPQSGSGDKAIANKKNTKQSPMARRQQQQEEVQQLANPPAVVIRTSVLSLPLSLILSFLRSPFLRNAVSFALWLSCEVSTGVGHYVLYPLISLVVGGEGGEERRLWGSGGGGKDGEGEGNGNASGERGGANHEKEAAMQTPQFECSQFFWPPAIVSSPASPAPLDASPASSASSPHYYYSYWESLFNLVSNHVNFVPPCELLLAVLGTKGSALLVMLLSFSWLHWSRQY